jgi:hypothetical protein
MTTAPQIKKPGGDKRWLVKNEQGETFGPVDFETLKLWAKDGRLAPTNTLSEDATTWRAVTHYPELEMDWVAEVSPGAFYGPIHRLALESLQKEGSLPADAVAFQRKAATASAKKTQPVSAIHPVVPTPQRNDAEAVHALERQLDLERQRSHDIMKQLQVVEVHASAAEARAEASQKAQQHYAVQSEQAQNHLTTQLDQVNKQLAHIHSQLFAKDQELHLLEQHLRSTEKLESMIQDSMARLGHQQQEILSVVASAQPRVDMPPAQEPSTAPFTVETHRVILDAIAEAQSHIARQVAQQVGDAFTRVQEQIRNSTSSAHDQATQSRATELEHVRLQFATALTSAQTGITSELNQSFVHELAKTHERFSSALLAAQRDAAVQTAQAFTQAIAPITAQVTQHRQELESFGALIHMSRTQTEEAVVSAVASLLAKGHEELFKKMGEALAAGRDQLFERTHSALAAGHNQLFEQTHTALTHGREQMMRAIGDSQRMAIEYIVREVTGTLTQALQAGRETLQQTLRSGWADMKQQTTVVEARLQELTASQQRLENDLKTALERSTKAAEKPVVERTYVKAEDVEVIPPERPRKKANPEPEIIDPPPARNAGTPNTSAQGPSIADIEQQARRELERLGAQGMNIFKRKN